jgi:hypothetical protein
MSKSAPASVRVLVTDAGGFIAHYLVGFLRERDYRVRGVDLKDPEYAPTAADEFLRVDLCGSGSVLPNEWQGACYLPTEAILEVRRLSARGRPVPRIAHEATICWLTSPLWGAFFKERYAPVIRQAVEADGPAFEQALKEAAGNKWGRRLWRAAADRCPEISATWVHFFRSPILASCWIQNLTCSVNASKRVRFQNSCATSAGPEYSYAGPTAHVLNASLPLSVLVDEVQHLVRASMLDQSTATLGWVRNPTTTNSAVTAEGATVCSTSVVGGDPEW